MQNRADRRKFHYIYKITRDDGYYYIGMHSTDDLDDGYFGSGTKIIRSIKRHGRDRHQKEIIEFLPSRSELRLREEELVNAFTLADPMCMNIAPGGQKVWVDHPRSELIIETISKKLKETWSDSEKRRKASATAIAQWSDPEKRKAQSMLKQEQHRNVQVILNISEATKVALAAPEVKLRMSSAKIANWQDPEYRKRQISAVHAVQLSEAYKEKQRAAKLGNRNPNFGTRWIHNPTMKKSTRIMKTEELPEGWLEGRRIYR